MDETFDLEEYNQLLRDELEDTKEIIKSLKMKLHASECHIDRMDCINQRMHMQKQIDENHIRDLHKKIVEIKKDANERLLKVMNQNKEKQALLPGILEQVEKLQRENSDLKRDMNIKTPARISFHNLSDKSIQVDNESLDAIIRQKDIEFVNMKNSLLIVSAQLQEKYDSELEKHAATISMKDAQISELSIKIENMEMKNRRFKEDDIVALSDSDMSIVEQRQILDLKSQELKHKKRQNTSFEDECFTADSLNNSFRFHEGLNVSQENIEEQFAAEENELLEGSPIVLCKFRNTSNEGSLCFNFEKNTVIAGDDDNSNRYAFDKVFEYDSSRKSLFESIKNLIQNVAKGKQTMMMSIGTTNAGKSYTMFGDLENIQSTQGIIQMSIQELFEQGMDIYISFSEVYNENIVDLLGKRSPSNARPMVENIKGTYLRKSRGVTEIKVEDLDHASRLLRRGIYRRQTHQTPQNKMSSRSNAFVSLRVHGKGEEKPISSLLFVDLAGYEKIHGSEAAAERKSEGTKINLSLLELQKLMRNMKQQPKSAYFRGSLVNNLIQNFLKHKDSQQIYAICATDDINQTTMTKEVLNFGSNIIKKMKKSKSSASSQLMKC